MHYVSDYFQKIKQHLRGSGFRLQLHQQCHISSWTLNSVNEHTKKQVIPSLGYVDSPPPLKKSHLHFFGSNWYECKINFPVFAIFIFWDIIVQKWEKLYPFGYKNEKDVQCSETDFWVHEFFCVILSLWVIVDFVFYSS